MVIPQQDWWDKNSYDGDRLRPQQSNQKYANSLRTTFEDFKQDLVKRLPAHSRDSFFTEETGEDRKRQRVDVWAYLCSCKHIKGHRVNGPIDTYMYGGSTAPGKGRCFLRWLWDGDQSPTM